MGKVIYISEYKADKELAEFYNSFGQSAESFNTICKGCGALYDIRRLEDVLFHEQCDNKIKNS